MAWLKGKSIKVENYGHLESLEIEGIPPKLFLMPMASTVGSEADKAGQISLVLCVCWIL